MAGKIEPVKNKGGLVTKPQCQHLIVIAAGDGGVNVPHGTETVVHSASWSANSKLVTVERARESNR